MYVQYVCLSMCMYPECVYMCMCVVCVIYICMYVNVHLCGVCAQLCTMYVYVCVVCGCVLSVCDVQVRYLPQSLIHCFLHLVLCYYLYIIYCIAIVVAVIECVHQLWRVCVNILHPCRCLRLALKSLFSPSTVRSGIELSHQACTAIPFIH